MIYIGKKYVGDRSIIPCLAKCILHIFAILIYCFFVKICKFQCLKNTMLMARVGKMIKNYKRIVIVIKLFYFLALAGLHAQET